MIRNKEDFSKYTASPNDSIKTCMARIEQNKKGGLIIIDENYLLLGSISDGDIRRAFLAGKGIDDAINLSYNTSPIKCLDHETDALTFEILIEKKITLLPIVDSCNVLIGIQTSEKGHRFEAVSNFVVIMVGGEGLRLGELTRSTPKTLLKVGGKPILQTILERLEYFGFRNIILCTGHLSEAIEEFCGDGSNFGLNISFYKEKNKLGTVGAVKNVENQLKEPFLVMNGDLLTGLNYKNILDFHKNNNSVMTIGCSNYTSKVPYGVIETEGVRVKRVLEKPTYSYRVSGGIYVLNHQLLDLIPYDRYFDITDLMEEIIAQEKVITAFPIEEYWLDIGMPNDFLKANEDYNQLFKL
ncbi:nucleotidyltransferase family protein [Flavobacterium cellulosilyticum]|uniref:CBS domain-containing protein n=1 Tax=Flavobacterium cellulosilyticum TaxID=2541731 RepID=A0A4R5CIN2_9FLAO|nr:nucleotidyltransferase family protein [Flavobacterium cellulosilyticum]TDD98410.1 CBS domain-containing protein [Flavobacterium cellulosilyticum]